MDSNTSTNKVDWIIEEIKLKHQKIRELKNKVPKIVSTGEIFILINQRKQNEVDKMESKIRLIQEECDHEWRLIKPVYLRETLIKKIFIL